MSTVKITIDGKEIEAPAGATILEAARSADIYIPTLCYHPDLVPAKDIPAAKVIYQGDLRIVNALPEEKGKGCGLCVVEIEGRSELEGSCSTEVQEGMVVITNNENIKARRQEKLVPILTRHRHACLTCAQQEGCSRSQCSSNVPENERCCPQFGHCELQNVANYVGISDSTPKWIPTVFGVFKEDPLFERDYNLCIGCTRCLRACRELRGVEAIGFVFDEKGEAQIGTLGPTLEESGCKFCTACVEVCPTGALMDKSVRPGKKEEDLVACREACPAHIDVPGYLRLIAQGKRDEAHAVIREKVPLPGILGRVCIHPCEEACRRGELNGAVSICALKRYAADGDAGLWKKQIQLRPDSGKMMAVVGSGPAGLAAAFYLRKQGHAVTVFETRDKAGGMMRYGIPAYRLPHKILDKEIQDIIDLGIDFKPNQTLGKDFTLAQLRDDGFEAVFIGVGAQLSRRISLEGCDLPGVMWGVDFLKEVADGKDVKLKENVLVIGGGNVAVDVAQTALRCGAKDVSMASLEGLDEMPASPWEVESAVAEGVKLMPSWGPEKILSKDGLVTGIDLVECTCVLDAQGNFCPEFNPERKECILVDQIILAVGQGTDLSFLAGETGIAVDRGLIVVNQDTLETDLKGVYAGGDVTSMPGAVIHGIAAGRKAAASMDKALGGDGDIDEMLFQRGLPDPRLGRDENFAFWPREDIPEIKVEAREGFQEIARGYSDEQADREARRCLQCDLRLYMGCNPAPPVDWLAFNAENIQQVPNSEGVFQLFDEEHNVLSIKGTANLRQELLNELEENEKAYLFEFEEDKMYSKRESELLQRYLQEHGEMPGGGDGDLDDLF